MKYLKRINENLNNFDEEFVKECFVEFYDNEKLYEPEMVLDYDGYYSILFNIPELKLYDEHSVDDFVKMGDDLYDFYHNIGNSITKVKMKYNYNVKMMFDQMSTTNISTDDRYGKRYLEVRFYY